ncbi:MAG: hypothetical protein ACJ71U_02005 [Terriglobales bacterium]|jgi:hypothetical protein
MIRMTSNILLFLVAILGLVLAPLGRAQVLVPPTPANQLSVAVSTNVTFDSASGLYTYTYTLNNASTSQQAAWLFALQLNGTVTSSSSPTGWSSAIHDAEPLLSWAATDVGTLPPDFVDTGNVPPSPFVIAPGAVLSGFQLVSPDPPGNATFFAQGDTLLTQVAEDTGDLPQEGQEVPPLTTDTFSGGTVGPLPVNTSAVFFGGRRPAVDGFLVFLNLASGDVRTAPVGVVIQFGIDGESVDTKTFAATLNGTDVTALFAPGPNSQQMTAIFALGSSPLAAGKNVLITSVAGIVPGTTRTANDVDRVTFTAQ